MRTHFLALVLVSGVAWAAVADATLQVHGQALILNDGIKIYNMTTRQLTAIGSGSAPAYSHDGSEVVFLKGSSIYVMNRKDGSNQRKICDLAHADMKDHSGELVFSYLSDGYIYWSEMRDEIYRANVQTKTREVYTSIRFVSKSGNNVSKYYGETGVNRLMVSNDGRYGSSISKGYNHVFALDLANAKMLSEVDGGCQGIMNCDATRIIHALTTPDNDDIAAGVYKPGTNGATGNTAARVEEFFERTTMGYLFGPAYESGANRSLKVRAWMASRNSPDHVVASGSNDTKGQCWVFEISSGKYMKLGGSGTDQWEARDFWHGDFDGSTIAEAPAHGNAANVPAKLRIVRAAGGRSIIVDLGAVARETVRISIYRVDGRRAATIWAAPGRRTITWTPPADLGPATWIVKPDGRLSM